MLRETRDADLVNRFANDPSVFPNIGAQGSSIDLTLTLDDPNVVYLTDGRDALMAFQNTGPTFLGQWEKHNLFRAGCRGRLAIETGIAMSDWLVTHRPVSMIWAQTPLVNRAARWFNRQIGMESRGMGMNRLVGPVEYFAMEAC